MIPVPSGLQTAHEELAAAAEDLLCVPPLVCVESAHGFGGLYVWGGGPIVVGHRDMHALAAAYVLQMGADLGRVRKRDFLEVVDLVYGRALAHEFGHALDDAGYAAPYFDREERADYFAGMLDAGCGKPSMAGAAVFFSIGCVGPACAHPPHEERAAAYLTGYADQMRYLRRMIGKVAIKAGHAPSDEWLIPNEGFGK